MSLSTPRFYFISLGWGSPRESHEPELRAVVLEQVWGLHQLLHSSLCDDLSFGGKGTRVNHDPWHWPMTVGFLIQCFLGCFVDVFYPLDTWLGANLVKYMILTHSFLGVECMAQDKAGVESWALICLADVPSAVMWLFYTSILFYTYIHRKRFLGLHFNALHWPWPDREVGMSLSGSKTHSTMVPHLTWCFGVLSAAEVSWETTADIKTLLMRKILPTSHAPGISGFDCPLFKAWQFDWYLTFSHFSW